MHVRNLCEFVKMGLLINLCDFCLCFLALLHSNVRHDKNLCSTNLYNLRLTRIIHINKSHAEIYRFMVSGSDS